MPRGRVSGTAMSGMADQEGSSSAVASLAERGIYGCLAGFTVTAWVLYLCDLLEIPWTRSLLVGLGLVAGTLALARWRRRAKASDPIRPWMAIREMPLESRLVTVVGLGIVLGAVWVFSVATDSPRESCH